MKNLKITANVEGFEAITVKSVNLMWIHVKEIFAKNPTVEITVVDEAGNDFKKLKLVDRKNGKKWMYNSVDETKRVKVKKDEKPMEVKSEEVEKKPENVKEAPSKTLANELDELVKTI